MTNCQPRTDVILSACRISFSGGAAESKENRIKKKLEFTSKASFLTFLFLNGIAYCNLKRNV